MRNEIIILFFCFSFDEKTNKYSRICTCVCGWSTVWCCAGRGQLQKLVHTARCRQNVNEPGRSFYILILVHNNNIWNGRRRFLSFVYLFCCEHGLAFALADSGRSDNFRNEKEETPSNWNWSGLATPSLLARWHLRNEENVPFHFFPSFYERLNVLCARYSGTHATPSQIAHKWHFECGRSACWMQNAAQKRNKNKWIDNIL